ncbi:MAG: MFS transporter [Rhizobiaceae bacterium]|jgi:MFS family permease|nr:MFS transporter [Rhizobiaceae bacterium]
MSGSPATLRSAKLTALTFAATQAIVGSAAPIAISTGGLAGYMLLGADKSLATAPVTGFNIGVAVGALPAAWLVARLGRQGGFMSGTGITALGGLVAFAALMVDAFWGFALGLLLIGMGGAFVQQYRFAAADAAPPAFKPKAISWVLFGGVFSAVIGPQIVIATRDLFAPHAFAGPFAAVFVLALIGALVIATVNVPVPVSASTLADTATPRPRAEIIRQPKFIAGLACGVGAYTMMTYLMTGAPLAMVGAGCAEYDAFLGISWHVMAMFAPSFFTGDLVVKFGKRTLILAGFGLLVIAAIIGLSGQTTPFFWANLILLGLGWNFAFIGATSLVAETYRPSEKGLVQGFHDAILFGSVAVASLMSGVVYTLSGWNALNLTVFPVAALSLAALVWGTRARISTA